MNTSKTIDEMLIIGKKIEKILQELRIRKQEMLSEMHKKAA